MQHIRSLLILAVAGLAACGGEPANNADTSTGAMGNVGASTAASTAGATASTATAAPATGSTAAAQPVTGKTWDVRMLGDASGYRFDPASITIKAGDAVRWTMVSGGPHNVTFWPDSIPQGAQQVLQGNMPQTMSALSGPLLVSANQTYTVSFGGAPKGLYHYYCTPHLAMGMKGTITVQ